MYKGVLILLGAIILMTLMVNASEINSSIVNSDGEGCMEIGDIGLDYYNLGEVRSPKNQQYDSISDYCIDSRTLREYFCDGKGNIGFSDVPCGLGCREGVCLKSECVDIGVRDKGKYCTIDKRWDKQKINEEACDNSFECESNLCIDNQCVDSGLFARIIRWFKGMFGG